MCFPSTGNQITQTKRNTDTAKQRAHFKRRIIVGLFFGVTRMCIYHVSYSSSALYMIIVFLSTVKKTSTNSLCECKPSLSIKNLLS